MIWFLWRSISLCCCGWNVTTSGVFLICQMAPSELSLHEHWSSLRRVRRVICSTCALKLYLTVKCSRVLSSKIWQKTARSGSVSYIYSYIYNFVLQRNEHTRPRIPQFLDNPYLGDITSRHEDSWQSIFCTRFLRYPLVHKCAVIYANSAEKEESSTGIRDRSQSQRNSIKEIWSQPFTLISQRGVLKKRTMTALSHRRKMPRVMETVAPQWWSCRVSGMEGHLL